MVRDKTSRRWIRAGVRGTSLIHKLECRNPRRGRLVFGTAIDELIRCEEEDADLCSTTFGQVTRQFRIAIVVHVPRAIRWRCVRVDSLLRGLPECAVGYGK